LAELAVSFEDMGVDEWMARPIDRKLGSGRKCSRISIAGVGGRPAAGCTCKLV